MNWYEDILCSTCNNGDRVTCLDCGYDPGQCYCRNESGEFYCGGCQQIFSILDWEDEFEKVEKYENEGIYCACEIEAQLVCNKCKVWREKSTGAWYSMANSPKCYCKPEKVLECKACGVERKKMDDLWDWAVPGSHYYYKCRHYFVKVDISDLVSVYASSLNDKREEGEDPDFGLYLSPSWTPVTLAYSVAWPDYDIPTHPAIAADAIVDCYIKAQDGLKVEIGCLGGHGRTGTVLACMYVMAGLNPADAVRAVRTNYCREAIEGGKQIWWVQWFEAYVNGYDLPTPPDGLFQKDKEPKDTGKRLPVYMVLEQPAQKKAKQAKRHRSKGRQKYKKMS